MKPAAAAQPTSSEGQGARILLGDTQLHFDADGDKFYYEEALHIRSEAGFDLLSPFAVSWDPATSNVTIHKLRIRRGGKFIDILAKQEFSVLRREQRMEEAMQDGVLTASLEPEGMEAGDIIEFAYTIVRKDTVYGQRTDFEWWAASSDHDKSRLTATWDSPKSVRWRAMPDLGDPKVSRKNGAVTLSIEVDNPSPLEQISGAPDRFARYRQIEFSEFASWRELSSLTAPLYDRAATLKPDSAVRAEIDRIRAASNDPKAQAAAALKLVQDKIRYLAMFISDGGYTPVDADTTWTRRYGDCKAKTSLLLAILRELGIAAEPALVNSNGAPILDKSLPRPGAFDHVIVRATIDGKVYWLDGTRVADGPIDKIDVPQLDFALPLRVAGADLEPLIPRAASEPLFEIAMNVDASRGVDADTPVTSEVTIRGDLARTFGVEVGGKTGKQRKEALEKVWESFTWFKIDTTTMERSIEKGETRIRATGKSTAKWTPKSNTGPRELALAETGFDGPPTKREGDKASEAPFALTYPYFTRYLVTVKLPHDGDGFRAEGDKVDLELAGRKISRTVTLKDGVMTVETLERTLAPEVAYAKVEADRERLEKVATSSITIKSPPYLRATEADLVAWRAETPKDADAYIERSIVLWRADDRKGAVADLDKAIELDPRSDFAFANRAVDRQQLGDLAGAKKDVAKALELNPRNFVAVQMQGSVALEEGRFDEAVQAYSRAIDLRENNGHAHFQRAKAYWGLGKIDQALADLTTADKIFPGDRDVVQLHATLLSVKGQRSEALAMLEGVTSQRPDVDFLVQQAELLSAMGRRNDAETTIQKALALKPSAWAHVVRSRNRDPKAFDQRLADLDAALVLDPKHYGASVNRALTLEDAGRLQDSLKAYGEAEKVAPKGAAVRLDRARVLVKLQRPDDAARIFDEFRGVAAGDAGQLNNLCWAQAISDFRLDAALADCEAALKLTPNSPAILDSRAFVLLKLGRTDEAIAAYDTALKAQPKLAASLYGRGVAKLRLGLAKEGRADIWAAEAEAHDVANQFERYGLKP